MTSFLSELVSYIIKFFLLFGVSMGGVFFGRHLYLKKKGESDNKNA